jgi:hypothetical protein
MIKSFISKIPLWGWIAFAVLILFIWQYVSGWAVSRKLYDMGLDQLRQDKTAIIESLKKENETRDQMILDLKKRVDAVQKQRILAEAESKRLAGLVDEKNKEILKLTEERKIITVPTDIDLLADEFRKRGYRPRIILPSR